MNTINKSIIENENDASLTESQQPSGFVDMHGETLDTVDLTSIEENVENVLKKNARIQRTPPSIKTGKTSVDMVSENDTSPGSVKGSKGRNENGSQRAEVLMTGRNLFTERIYPPVKTTEQEELLQKCKNIINKMKAATIRQKNISNDIKVGLMELEEAFSAIAYGISKQKRSETLLAKGIGLQQSPRTPDTAGSQKRPAMSPADEQNQLEKKVRDEASLSAGEAAWERQLSRRERKRENLEAKKSDNRKPENTKLTADPGNIPTTKTRNRGRGGKRRRFRPEALIIRPAEGKSYAEVLGEIRSKVRPEESGTEIQSIRQTKTGDVLLELGPNSNVKDGFRCALRDALGDQAKILNLQSRVPIEIRDLDGCTTESEVAAALKREIPDWEKMKINLFPCSRGQQVAIIQMSRNWAATLLKEGRIKIGWVYCRVRERAVAARCFRCSGYGHMAKDCNGPDRSNLCYKCFGVGHKARGCTAEINCMLCTEKGFDQAELTHFPGSGKCQVYRGALQAAKNRL